MAQIRRGLVNATNGSTTVRHVWTVYFATVPAASFVVGETLTWTGGGVGICTAWNGELKELRFYRTSGAIPVLNRTPNVTTTGSTSTASGIFVDMGDFDPPNFDGLLSPGATNLFTVLGTPYVYQISATITEDSFVLTGAYGQTTFPEIGYGIAVSFTPNLRLPLIEYGDADAPSLISRALSTLDARFPPTRIHARYIANSGTAGSAFPTGGAFSLRPLNDLSSLGLVSGATLGTSRLSGVPAGTYDVNGWGLGHNCGNHRILLRNITAGTDLLLGTNSGGGTTNANLASHLQGRIVLTTTTALEMHGRCSVTGTYGTASSFGTEVYADLLLTKVL